MEAYENALKEVEKIVANKENLIERYVMASNSLSVEADADNNDYAYEYAKYLTDLLKGLIVNDTVSKAGYYVDDSDTFHRWKKSE